MVSSWPMKRKKNTSNDNILSVVSVVSKADVFFPVTMKMHKNLLSNCYFWCNALQFAGMYTVAFQQIKGNENPQLQCDVHFVWPKCLLDKTTALSKNNYLQPCSVKHIDKERCLILTKVCSGEYTLHSMICSMSCSSCSILVASGTQIIVIAN